MAQLNEKDQMKHITAYPADNDQQRSNSSNSFRTILPQILASTAKNLLLIDIGLAIAFPTIVIPVLRGLQSDRFPDEPLHFTAEQASWYGSMGFIGQPIGSALSGWLTEPIGRKRAMILVNIPHIIAWTMLYHAQTPAQMYAAVVLIGLGTGLMEAPILTYVGEICQPSVRGVLLACSMVAAMIGFLIVYVMGTLTSWRNAALVCLCVPLISMVAICFVPETPYWLLSKNRVEDARRSLQWLRGWRTAAEVEQEFAELQRCSAMSHACTACKRADSATCTHRPSGWYDAWRELFRHGTRRPFGLIMVAFVLVQFSGLSAVRPFMVQLFQTFAIPMDPNMGTVWIAVLNISANVVCMCTLKLVGKRNLFLFSLLGCLLSCFSIAILAHAIFPPGYSSFDQHHDTVAPSVANTLAMYMFFSLAFFTNLGLYPVTFTLLSEIFPFRTRGIATGLAVAISYLFSFVSVKTFLNLEHCLSIAGTFCLYGTISLIGFCFMYAFLPETEGRSLEEVEHYFSDKNRRMTDRFVAPIQARVASKSQDA